MSWLNPKLLGMTLIWRLRRGKFCWEGEGEKGVKRKKVDRDSSHLATLCCDLITKSNDKHMQADNTQIQKPACKDRKEKNKH